MGWEKRISIDPQIQGGRPVIRGTRVPVRVVVGSLAGGDSIDEVCEGYGITREDLQAALAYAAEAVEYASIYLVPDR